MRKAFFSSIFFVLGFSAVFVSLGATATVVGGFLQRHLQVLMIVGGIVIIMLGLHILGAFRIRALYGEKRFRAANLPKGFLGALIDGERFDIGIPLSYLETVREFDKGKAKKRQPPLSKAIKATRHRERTKKNREDRQRKK